jgi:tetratricopeptide (TPR) repeat protein
MLLVFRKVLFSTLLLTLVLSAGSTVCNAQSSAGEGEPVSLFQKGQDAHERGDLKAAVEFYGAAIKLKPDFPEAEYQRATALLQIGNKSQAERGYRRALELRPDWAPPYAALGSMYIEESRQDEALKLLTEALKRDPGNATVLKTIGALPYPTTASKETLSSALDAIKNETTATSSSVGLMAEAALEDSLGDKAAASSSLDQAIAADPSNALAYERRAMIRAQHNEMPGAISDAEKAHALAPTSANSALLLARLYVQADRAGDALRTLDGLPPNLKASTRIQSLRNTILAGSGDSPEARNALEAILKTDQNNAAVLARLGALYRMDDPARSLDYYRRALQIEPRNAEFATGYGAALVQARRFPEAAGVLRQVVAVAPDNFAAHANLATALYESKDYPGAVNEYNWLLSTKPDLYVAHFFIATAYDYTGQFPAALEEYQTFLANADPEKNRLEIEKVNLRLPSLRNQIKKGEGVKKKGKG